MAINIGFQNIADNIGVEFQIIILILFVGGTLIFYARDFRIGAIMTFLSAGCIFMLNYQMNWDTQASLIIFLGSVVVLALSLYAVGKASSQGTLT